MLSGLLPPVSSLSLLSRPALLSLPHRISQSAALPIHPPEKSTGSCGMMAIWRRSASSATPLVSRPSASAFRGGSWDYNAAEQCPAWALFSNGQQHCGAKKHQHSGAQGRQPRNLLTPATSTNIRCSSEPSKEAAMSQFLTNADGAAGDWDEAEQGEHQARLAAAGAPHHAAADAALRGAWKLRKQLMMLAPRLSPCSSRHAATRQIRNILLP